MKLNSLLTGRIGKPECRKFLGSQPTHDEFCHKKTFCDYWDFLMLLATVWALCTINPLELVDRESVEICDQTQKWCFFVMIDFFFLQQLTWSGVMSISSVIRIVHLSAE